VATLVKPSEHAWVRSSGFVDNAPAVASKAGEPGKTHFIALIRAAYSNPSTSGSLVLRVGGEVVAETTVHGDVNLSWYPAIQAAPDADVSVELAPSGTEGVTGSVILSGYTF